MKHPGSHFVQASSNSAPACVRDAVRAIQIKFPKRCLKLVLRESFIALQRRRNVFTG